MAAVLQTDLSVDYRTRSRVLDHLAITVDQADIVGLVGQSGSGKTTFAMALLGLLDAREATVSGKFLLNETQICGIGERDLARIRGRLISLIPQNPAGALAPFLRIGRQLKEAWLAHREDWISEGLTRSRSLLKACTLPSDDAFLNRYPDQISVGQAQRVLIAMALLHDPLLLIADEPTSALDLLTQREILDLLARIRADRQMSVLFISHDLQAVASLCNKIAILHEGKIVERGTPSEVLTRPVHAFTKLLVAAVPKTHIAEIRV